MISPIQHSLFDQDPAFGAIGNDHLLGFTLAADHGQLGFDLNGAVMASDAFFPFPDCVEIADKEGITAVIQPGGSVKDDLSFAYCNEHGMAMVTTGIRHFKH